MKISQKTIDEIFNTAVIEDVISEFVALKKAGANYKGLSPFNEEKTPSFVVSPSKEIWKDFSSGKGGNIISFLMEHEQHTYPEALLFLAKKYNINVEYLETDSKKQEEENERQATLIALNFAKDFFVKTLFDKGPSVLNYLNSRDFSLSLGITILAGTPTAVKERGTSLVTTEFAPTRACSPIITGPRICAPDPMITPSPKVGWRFWPT